MVHGFHPVTLPVASSLLVIFSFNIVGNTVGPSWRTSLFPVPLRHPLDQDAVALGGGRRLRGRGQHQRFPDPVAGRLVSLGRLLLLLVLRMMLLRLSGVGRCYYVLLLVAGGGGGGGGRVVVMVVDRGGGGGAAGVVGRDGGGGRRVVGHGPAGGGGGRGLDVLLRLPGGVHNVVLILIVERVV